MNTRNPSLKKSLRRFIHSVAWLSALAFVCAGEASPDEDKGNLPPISRGLPSQAALCAMSNAGDETWMEFPALGRTFAEHDPWLWPESLRRWLYILDHGPEGTWMYVATESTGNGDPVDPALEPGAAGEATVTVSTYGELTAAVAVAGPGTIIELEDGIYAGSRITVTRSGTEEEPIVIRAANLLGANIPNTFQIYGANIVIRGLEFITPLSASTLEMRNDNVQVWRCRFKSLGGTSIYIGLSTRCRVMYCEFSSQDASDWWQATNSCIRSGGGSDQAYDVEIGYCYFHDMPGKPVGAPYSARGRNLIVTAPGNTGATLDTNWHIHHCLAVDTGNCRFSINSSGNLVEFVTVTGRTGNNEVTASTDVSVRFGANNVIRGCWKEDADGFLVWDQNNTLIGCKTVNSQPSRIARGDNLQSGGLQYPQARNTKVVACDFDALHVGAFSWAGSLPVVDTRIENHTGSVSLQHETGTVQTDEMTETPVTPVKILPEWVGPHGTGRP